MQPEHIIEFVGGTEVDVAYLRLLLRKVSRELSSKWRLRAEEDGHVDLLVIEDIDSSAVRPDAAHRRVRLIDPKLGAGGMQTVPWPIAQETLVRVLNLPRVPAPARAPEPIVANPVPEIVPTEPTEPALGGLMIQHNIYDDLFEPDAETGSSHWGHDCDTHELIGEVDLAGDWLAAASSSARGHHGATLMHEAESFFRADYRVDQVEALRQIRLHPEVALEATDGHTHATSLRKDRRGVIELAADTPYVLSAAEASAQFPLATYLGGRLLPGPSKFVTDTIVLVLDPRQRLYYADGGLGLLEDCCKRNLARGEWRILSADEFTAVKAQRSPRPYAELQWLCAYFDAQAAKGPDDILRYRILGNLEVLSRDYPVAARIAAHLERGSSLKAAAAAVQVPLLEARRVAAAFDAAGLLVPD